MDTTPGKSGATMKTAGDAAIGAYLPPPLRGVTITPVYSELFAESMKPMVPDRRLTVSSVESSSVQRTGGYTRQTLKSTPIR
jgi:hypothetical protein